MIMTMKKGNKLGDAGAEMINESLKTNSTLTILDLSGDMCMNTYFIIDRGIDAGNEKQTTKLVANCLV